MRVKKFAMALLGVVAILNLLSCASSLPKPSTTATPVTASGDQNLPSVYSRLAEAGGKVFTLNPKTSTVRIYVYRAGRAAQLGHNHVLSAPQFTGLAYLPSALPTAGLSNARFDLEFRLDQLEIDNPANRSILGNAFSSSLTTEAIASTRDHMLGADAFQADRFPFVRIHSLEIVGEAPKLAVKVQIDLHGQSREMWVPLNIEGLPDTLTVSGSFVLRQSDFGVSPYSVMSGLLAVRDEVVIEFKLVGA